MQTLPNVRVFAPELWGQVDKFSQFHKETHTFNSDVTKAVGGINGHFQKALILRNLARRLEPNLAIDETEIREKGYTPASYSQEFSAVIEEVFTELYSSIDCARKVITTIYKKCRGIPDSTRKLFARAAAAQIGTFPTELQTAFQSAVWFDELRAIRDELTHSGIGSCHKQAGQNNVTYMHGGILTNKKPLVINDVFGKIEEFINGVNLFLGQIFHFLNSQLKNQPTFALCGFFFGRAYARLIAIEEQIDFNSGTCQSRNWFDSEPDYKCPFADNCGAYQRAAASAESAQ